MREADISDGSRVEHGSSKHVKDLETRIRSLVTWRDRQKRGSEARANYSRLISRLKSELASARRAAAKKNMKEAAGDPGEETPQERWQKLYDGETADDMVKRIVQSFKDAADPRALAQVKRKTESMQDSGMLSTVVTDGFIHWLFDKRKAELGSMNSRPRSAADARADRVLHTSDSTGRRTARRMS